MYHHNSSLFCIGKRKEELPRQLFSGCRDQAFEDLCLHNSTLFQLKKKIPFKLVKNAKKYIQINFLCITLNFIGH